MEWRFIDTDLADPFYVTAADETLCNARMKEKIENTCHFYRRNLPTISVGRSRKIEEDINLLECNQKNVKVIRRTTGGGTIFTDKNCLIYSLVFDKQDINLNSSEEIFTKICNLISNSLRQLNVDTTFKPPNDILLKGKKISGSAQINKHNITLIHGTLLLDTDLNLMKSVLKNNKTNNVSTIFKEQKSLPDITKLKNTIKREFESYFQSEFTLSKFSSYEEEMIRKLIENRYKNDNWNLMR